MKLGETVPEISVRYQNVFSELSDENRISLNVNTLNKGKEDALELLEEVLNSPYLGWDYNNPKTEVVGVVFHPSLSEWLTKQLSQPMIR